MTDEKKAWTEGRTIHIRPGPTPYLDLHEKLHSEAHRADSDVCLDCPVWAWEEQPHGMYGFDAHPVDLGHGLHEWRGARIVPVNK